LDLDFNVRLTASDTALWMTGLTFLLPQEGDGSQLSPAPPLHGWRRYAIPFELIAPSHRARR
jgi:hypothetical protein